MAGPNLKISASSEEGAADCCAFILSKLSDASRGGATATLAISGGSTPKLLFADLAKSGFDWSKVHLFWVDERCVPPTDSQSNFKLANDIWLAKVDYPKPISIGSLANWSLKSALGSM